jgi:hypothetical protein
MATKNFTQFAINTSLSSTDYLVGYYGNGSEEFKLSINNLKTYLEPTTTVSTTTEFSGTNLSTLQTASGLNLTIPPNTRYAVTGQLFLKEVRDVAPGIDFQVIATPNTNVNIYGNHYRFDLVDLPVAVAVPLDVSVGTRSKIMQLDATSYGFFSVPVSYVVYNTSNASCVLEHRFAQSVQEPTGTFVLGIGSYLIGHPINS